jgi:hypothetical protein
VTTSASARSNRTDEDRSQGQAEGPASRHGERRMAQRELHGQQRAG